MTFKILIVTIKIEGVILVVIHEYNHTPPSIEDKPPKPEEEEQQFSGEPIPEEKAFWVGLSVITISVVLILVAIVGRLVWRHQQTTANEQILGTQEQNIPAAPNANQPLEVNQSSVVNESEKEITTKGEEYAVEGGDSLASIGAKFNVDWHKIAQINKLESPYNLIVGQKLIIPLKE